MFDLFRRRDKAVRYLLGGLLMLVAISMVVTLIPGYGSSSNRADDDIIADIGKESITAREVQKTVQDAVRQKQIPAEMVSVYVPRVIDQLITDNALVYEAKRMGMNVSDEELATAIRSLLARFTGGGQPDKVVYERIINEQGMTIPEFENNVRKQMLLTRLQNVALEGVIVTPKEVESEYSRRNAKVKIEYMAFKPENFKSEVKLTPEAMQTYYNNQKENYRVQEKKNLLLLVADQDKIAAALQISDDQLRAAYDRNKDHFRTPERVKVRHILLQTANKPPAEVDKIKAKALDVLKQVKNGGNFAELAKKYSEDPGSASKGGDLDWVVRGQMVKNFENAAFSLKPNQIGDLVTTEYGFHIVQVLDKQEARLQPFEEVKGQLATEMKKSVVFDRMQTSIDQARAALQKNPNDYEAIAKQYGLEVVKADGIGAGAPIPGLGQSPDLDAALATMKKGQVSSVTQFGTTKLAVAEVADIVPPRIQSFVEVEPSIREALTDTRSKEIATEKAAEAVKRLNAGEPFEAVAKALHVEVKTPPEFTSEAAVEGIGSAVLFGYSFTKPVGSVLGPTQAPGQAVVAKLLAKTSADMSQLASQREAIVLQLKQQKARERQELFYDSVLTELIREGKVKKHNQTIQRLINSYRG
jgi:peptidyl-prolyl cis-trans isomerase D